jgi:hypothetical protein
VLPFAAMTESPIKFLRIDRDALAEVRASEAIIDAVAQVGESI